MYYCERHWRHIASALPLASKRTTTAMTYNQNDLPAYFHSLTDEALISQCLPGRLTEAARAVAEAEVRSRGLRLPEMARSDESDTTDDVYHGDFKNVARFLDPTEAHLIKAHLESCGVPALVADANLVQANPFLGGAIGGTSVRVPEAFAAEAVELIAKFNRGEFQDDESHDNSNDAGDTPASAVESRRLKTFRVYAHPDQPVPIVVKVGFSWAAFIFGPLWFLVNRMWMNFAIVAALFGGGNLYFRHQHPSTEAGLLLFAGMYVLFFIAWFMIGKFANSLLAIDLEDKGYRLVATVKARNPTYARDEAVKLSASQHTAP